jgi:selenophosphate synthetase-related protein
MKFSQSAHILQKIKNLFKDARNISQKRDLIPILDRIRQEGYHSSQIYAAIGEDAAAIRIQEDSDQLLLVSTDAILTSFIEKSPYAAGFSAIYVNVDDIFACGGIPTAATVIMEYSSNKFGNKILDGLIAASQKYRIPLIRGHTVTDAIIPFLSTTVIGTTSIIDFISIQNHKINDNVALVFDPEGKPGENNPQFWNTILDQQSDRFFEKRRWIRTAHHKKLFHGCKDVSNGGIIGTVYQILKSTCMGMKFILDELFDINLILNRYYSPEQMLFAYLTSSFIISYPPANEQDLIEEITICGMKFCHIGIFIKNHTLELIFNSDHEFIDING